VPKTIDLLAHPLVPIAIRRSMQAVSFEAEVLAILRTKFDDPTPAGRRFAALRDRAKLLADSSLSYIRSKGGA